MKKNTFGKRSFLSLLVIFALLAAMALVFTACRDRNNQAQGETVEFTFEVTKVDGSTKSFSVKTDKTNVGDALVAEGIVSGEDGDYGWFVTTVDGEYHNWDDDGKYWAFYIDGEYAMTGVSATPITEGTVYSFKAE